MNKEIIKKYSNDDLTIVWKPSKCIHAGVCVRMLPDVYNPIAKPWVKIENASTEELKSQINRCPSRALSFYMKNENQMKEKSQNIEVEVLKNGPLMVKGTLKIKNVDGSEEIKDKMSAFCRCGASTNKPYCDGAHVKINFQG